MIKRLILVRTDLGWNRLVPFLGIGEYRIDIEHHAAERIEAVAHDLADLIFGVANLVHVRVQFTSRVGRECNVTPGPLFIAHSAEPFAGLFGRQVLPDRPKPWPVSRWRR